MDADLARLYVVSTKALNQAVKRNSGRFPRDFSFRLTEREKEQVVTNCDHLQALRYSSASARVESRYDGQLRAVFVAIRKLMAPLPEPPRKRIGF